ncbi:MAG: hypothetical protein RLN88_04195 [Ekhidna sp.]|uniref:hypothetical protein n=1 Tax=Ekhidna sp. TaxID=2608089 RepID=UPI0032EBE7C0
MTNKQIALMATVPAMTDEEIDSIIEFLKAENTEGVSTSSRTESGVSHGVSDRNASRSDSDEPSEEVVGGTLALRTQDENLVTDPCEYCGKQIENPKWRVCDSCYNEYTWD